MRVLIVFLFGLCCIFGEESKRLWITDYMPENKNATDNQLGICYGSSTQWATYPYAVALRYASGSACCSASIVSLNPPVLLTAAHCNGCVGAARIGCNNPSTCGNADSYTVAGFTQHPNYGQGTQFSNDIALVTLSQAITTSGAAAVTIPSSEGSVAKRAVGYGITQSGAIPTSLQTATFNHIANNDCQSIMAAALGPGTYIDNSMVCIRGGSAGSENVAATCSGDSGGPWTATSNRVQYGVTSWGLQGSGPGCDSCACCTGYPGVGANVAYFSDWINGYLQDWDLAYERDQNLTRALRMEKSME